MKQIRDLGFRNLIVLCLIFLGCNNAERLQFSVDVNNDDYLLSINANELGLRYDSTKILRGDPILFAFVNLSNTESFDVYVGTVDPYLGWRSTFDYTETNYTLKEQVEFDTVKSFINQSKLEWCGYNGKIVQYSNRWFTVIESQYECLDSLRINIVMREKLTAKKKNVLKRFSKILNSIKLDK